MDLLLDINVFNESDSEKKEEEEIECCELSYYLLCAFCEEKNQIPLVKFMFC